MKEILKASSHSLRTVHLSLRLIALVLLWFIPLTPAGFAVSFVCFLFYFTVAQSIMLHRYYSHRMFEFANMYVKQFFVWITLVSLRGSPIGWAYIHKIHHETVDTEQDPHSPHHKPVRLFGLMDGDNVAEKIQVFKIKSLLTKENLHINDYYWLYALSPLVLAIFNLEIFFYVWLLPVVLFQVVSNLLNYANHYNIPGAYKNFQADNTGHSVNNWLLFPISLGEAWHNNHHAYPGLVNFGQRTWEIDPSSWIIKLVRQKKKIIDIKP